LKLRRRKALIDEELCDGCGLCIPACHEGAIRIVEGKAKVIEELCDGIGDCLKECPKGAIRIVEEEVEVDFQWPVKLKLMNPESPVLRTSKLTFMAECAPLANPDIVRDSFEEGATLILCPKFDDLTEHEEKIRRILERNNYEEIRAVRMIVPCCRGILGVLERALKEMDANSRILEVIVAPSGEIQREVREL